MLLQDEVGADFGHQLIDIGSCGLHTLHNAFKTGVVAAEWNISSVLKSLYYLFKDAPARREDYLSCANSEKNLPLKFVDHRWLENVPVCRRAIAIWPFVKDYVKKVQDKKFQKPSCHSFDVLSDAVKDQLILVKFEFFCVIADILQPFLKNFQSEKPLVPFLSSELCTVVRSLMRKFIKPEVLESADTASKLTRIEIMKSENHVSPKKIDIGFGAEAELKKATKATEKQVFDFRMQCKQFLIAILKKAFERSPLKNSLVRYLCCLDPRMMVKDKSKCELYMKNVLKHFVFLNRLSNEKAETILQQYTVFLENISTVGSQKFKDFKPFSSSLDRFFIEVTMSESIELFEFVKMILVMSHGQANVERGFSSNKKIEVENLSHRGLVAQRIVCDYVQSVGGVLNVPITNKLLVCAASARQKYEAYLQSEKEKSMNAEQNRKRKSVVEQIEEIKKRKVLTENDIEHLEKNAEMLYEKAETSGNLRFVSEANCNRRRAKEKKELLMDLSSQLDEKLKKLKEL